MWRQKQNELDFVSTFAATTGAVLCCNPGKYLQYDSSNGLLPSCVSCAPGTYQNESEYMQTRSCRSCEAGYFQKNFEATMCIGCPRGFSQNESNGAYCVPCLPGKYQDKLGQSLCVPCVKGRYQPRVSAKNEADCNKCSAGKFSNSDQTFCDLCPPGMFGREGSGHSNAATACHNCPPGRYSMAPGIANETGCNKCPPGQFGNQSGGSVVEKICTNCQAGQYREGWADPTVCSMCSKGFHQKMKGQVTCLPCLPGEFGNETGMKRCHKCAIGMANEEANATKCMHCKSGQSADKNGNTKCALCGVGQFSMSNGRKCAMCPQGFFQNITGASSCRKVSIGSITLEGRAAQFKVPLGSYIECSRSSGRACQFKPCPAGKYGMSPPQETPCRKCPAGWSSFDSSLKCFFCAKGKFADLPGMKCKECPSGYFQPRNSAASTSCEQCPRGYKQANKAESSCISLNWLRPEDCGSNEYLNNTDLDPNNWTCLSCPTGGSCIGTKTTWATLEPMFGWWKIAESERRDLWDQVFAECLYPPACPGAANPSLQNRFIDDNGIDLAKAMSLNRSNTCASELGFKSESRLCHACKPRHQRYRVNQCAKCPERGANIGLLFLGVIVVCGLIAYIVRSRLRKRGRKHLHQSVKKIMVNYLQVISLARWFPLRWPESLSTLFEVQGALSTLGDHIFSMNCISDLSSAADIFYLKQAVYACMPLLLSLISFFVWYIYGFYSGESFFAKRPTNDRQKKTPKDIFVLTCNSIIFLIYPMLCYQALSIFHCRQVGKEQYLHADLDEQCYVGRHLHMMISLGIPQLVVYVIGLPISLLVFLWRNNRDLHSDILKSEADEKNMTGLFLDPVVVTRWGLFFFRWVNHVVYLKF